jgi:hypothetical protein
MIILPLAVRENPPIPFVLKSRKVEIPVEALEKTQRIRMEF